MQSAPLHIDRNKRVAANILAVITALLFLATIERPELLSPLSPGAGHTLLDPLKARVARVMADMAERFGSGSASVDGATITYTSPSGTQSYLHVASIYPIEQTPIFTLILLIGAILAWRWWCLGWIRGLLLILSAPLATFGLLPILSGICLAAAHRIAEASQAGDLALAQPVSYQLPVILTAVITMLVWWMVKKLVSDDSEGTDGEPAKPARPQPAIRSLSWALLAFAACLFVLLPLGIARGWAIAGGIRLPPHNTAFNSPESAIGWYAILGGVVCGLAYLACGTMMIMGLARRKEIPRGSWLPILFTLPWGGGGLLGAAFLTFLVLVVNDEREITLPAPSAPGAAPVNMISPLSPWICALTTALFIAVICAAAPWHALLYSPLAITLRCNAVFWPIAAVATGLILWNLFDRRQPDAMGPLLAALALTIICAVAHPLLADADPAAIALRQPLKAIASRIGNWTQSEEDDSDILAQIGFAFSRDYVDTQKARAAGINLNSGDSHLSGLWQSAQLERRVPLSVVHVAAQYSPVPSELHEEGFSFQGPKSLSGWKSVPITILKQPAQLRLASNPADSSWIGRIALADGKLETDIDQLRQRLNGRWRRPRTWIEVELMLRGGDEQQAIHVMTEFFDVLMPEIDHCLPDAAHL